MNKHTDFWQGVIIGFACALIILGMVLIFFLNKREAAYGSKELLEYAEKQVEIEKLREDYRNRDPVEFLDDIPGVRGAADGATVEFERKRDEILQRFRSRLVD